VAYAIEREEKEWNSSVALFPIDQSIAGTCEVVDELFRSLERRYQPQAARIAAVMP
jgi:hypothetical protein